MISYSVHLLTDSLLNNDLLIICLFDTIISCQLSCIVQAADLTQEMSNNGMVCEKGFAVCWETWLMHCACYKHKNHMPVQQC